MKEMVKKVWEELYKTEEMLEDMDIDAEETVALQDQYDELNDQLISVVGNMTRKIKFS